MGLFMLTRLNFPLTSNSTIICDSAYVRASLGGGLTTSTGEGRDFEFLRFFLSMRMKDKRIEYISKRGYFYSSYCFQYVVDSIMVQVEMVGYSFQNLHSKGKKEIFMILLSYLFKQIKMIGINIFFNMVVLRFSKLLKISKTF